MSRRDTLKITALVLPLLLGIAVLHAFGNGMTLFFVGLFSGRGYETHSHGAWWIVARRGSDYHDFAARKLDEFTRVMLEKHRDLGLHAPDPATERLTVYLLDSREEFERKGFTNAMADLSNNGGYFNPAKLEIALEVGHEVKNTDIDARGLRHEMMHALLHLRNRDAEWSPWLDEGMATYFETSWQKPSVPGSTREHVAALVEKGRHIPLSRLLSAEGRDFTGEQNRDYYSECHLLVAFLYEDRHLNFREYLDRESRPGRADPAAFEAVFGKDVEAEWLKWIAKK